MWMMGGKATTRLRQSVAQLITVAIILCVIVKEGAGFAIDAGDTVKALVKLDSITGEWSMETAISTVANDFDTRFDTAFNEDDVVCRGSFEDGMLKNGWGILDLESNGAFPDDKQAFAAGVFEGWATGAHIRNTAANLVQGIFKAQGMTDSIGAFFDTQEEWSRRMVSKLSAKDPFWAHVGFVMQQYDGLVKGFEMSGAGLPANTNLTVSQMMQMLNGVGDLFDIMPAVHRHKRVNFLNMTRNMAEWWHATNGHCSALIKVADDMSDLFVGHSSWYIFSNTARIMKHYSLNYSQGSRTASRKLSFSSYPGFLESLDDFYMLESGLTWTQTSIAMMNQSVYDVVTPNSLLAWQRVRVASAMAHSGSEWHDIFKKHASGTYANTYMIVDMNRFTPGQALVDGTLWVIEEMPGLVTGADQTDKLRFGYWPSFNVPYYPEVFNRAGYADATKKFGTFWTFDLNPRNKIFRRDHGAVQDLDGLKRLLRSNRYKDDPFSFDGVSQNPMYAICSRGDLMEGLNGNLKTPMGCYDTKVTSFMTGAKERKAEIINGPTSQYSGGGLAPFNWAEFPTITPVGLPKVYTFDFVNAAPKEFNRMAQHQDSQMEEADI